MTRTMKDSGIDWIGEIPEDWSLNRTKNYFINHKDIAGEKSDEYERLALTLNGVIRRSKEDSTGLQPEAFDGYQILRQNELVFKLIDLENISTSRVGLCPFKNGIVSPAYIILTPRDNINPKYSEYYYLSMWHREIFNHIGDYGVRSSLNAKDLLNVPITRPSMPEQQKIADFLDEKCSHIDSVLEKTRASIEEYKQLKQSVITKAVTKGIRPNRPMKDSGIEWIGEIPEDWKIAQLKRFLKSNNGSEIKQEVNKDDNEAIPVYGSGGVFKYTNEFMYSGEVVMFGRKGTLGKPLYVNDTFWTVDTMYYLNNFNGLIAKYTYYLLVAFDWIPFITQTALPSIVSSQIIAQHFPIPSLKEQQEIVLYLDNKCSELDKLITKKEQLIEELETYKKSLIYEYVTGKKEVC